MAGVKTDTSSALESIHAALCKNEFERALWLAEQEVRHCPDDALALSYVGRIKATLRRDRQHALDTCIRAFARAPVHAQVAANLAWAHHLCGHAGPAKEALERALQLDGGLADAVSLAKRIVATRRPSLNPTAPAAAAGAGLWDRIKLALRRRS